MEIKKITCSFSAEMLLSTILLSIIILGALAYVTYNFINTNIGDFLWYVKLSIILILIATYLYAFTAQIRALYITNETVIIKKVTGRIAIHRNDIVRVYQKRSMMTDVRLCGISGLFGHIGLFYNKNIGRYYANAKDGNNLIAIVTQKKVYVISCDNANKVISVLQ